MRSWSSEYCDWRVALVTEGGEEVCTVLDIFFTYFYAFYWLLYDCFFVLCLLLAQFLLLFLVPSSSFYDLLLLIVLSHSQVHFRTLEWTTSLIVVYKEALDHLGRSDLSDTV
jgi:hypothetical protein